VQFCFLKSNKSDNSFISFRTFQIPSYISAYIEILILDIYILFIEFIYFVNISTGHESMVLHWCKPVNKFERLFSV
jgi:hypothetical protein